MCPVCTLVLIGYASVGLFTSISTGLFMMTCFEALWYSAMKRWLHLPFQYHLALMLVKFYTRPFLVMYDIHTSYIEISLSQYKPWKKIPKIDQSGTSESCVNSLITCVSPTAPIAAFRKRDKHEKDDIIPERVPQGRSWFVGNRFLIGDKI